tara:strand:- start:479 stop:760 length:282 start_codon:yes stop_codon:yes gene_type:complete
MDAKEFSLETINEENCNWTEFQQCTNHKSAIIDMMEDYLSCLFDRKDIIKQIDSITEWLDICPDAGDIETAIEELNSLKESLINPKNNKNAKV